MHEKHWWYLMMKVKLSAIFDKPHIHRRKFYIKPALLLLFNAVLFILFSEQLKWV